MKALSNRYAVEILRALSPRAGDIVPSLGWDDIVDNILIMQGLSPPSIMVEGERTEEQSKYEKRRKQLATAGTLYESMEKLVASNFVRAVGERGRKHRRYMITHDGRLALSAMNLILGPTPKDTVMGRAAKVLLRYKNFVRLLPAQAKFLEEIRDVSGNLILQMPPGSGKTFLAMMIILTKLEQGVKCLYMTPLISISRQLIDEYGDLLSQLGYSVVRYDAHSDATEEMLEKADFIIGIYESVLSAFLSKRGWLNKVKLVVVDELTELGGTGEEPTPRALGTDRSCRLDLLITRLKNNAQIITLSSRFGDTDTVAKWLDAAVFRPNVRLVPDEYVVTPDDEGVRISSADGTHMHQSTERSRLDAIHEYIGEYKTKSLLVVVGSRESAEFYAQRISKAYPRDINNEVIERIIGDDEDLPAASRLKALLEHGVAFHHAGLTTSLRGRLERELKLGNIRCVVSTTGIAAGASFPFDYVAIVLDRALRAFIDRSRYLQIAGRIGEYYLTEHGGSVFIALSKETVEEEQDDVVIEELLHQPLIPLRPGPIDPYLLCALIVEEIIGHRRINTETIVDRLLMLVRETLRGTTDAKYVGIVRREIEELFKWMEKMGITSMDSGGVYVGSDAKHAIHEELNPLDYVKVRDRLHDDVDFGETELIDTIMKFRLVQVTRPRTYVPTKVELKAAGLGNIDDWYSEQVKKRETIKREVMRGWINEEPIREVIETAIEMGINGDERARRWMSLDEGDMITMMDWAADIALSIAAYLKRVGRKKSANQFVIFSKRLRFGLKEDAASSDLMDLVIPCKDGSTKRLSRVEIRTLVDRGYASIQDIVRKDIDPSKRKPARTRFSKNCGLDPGYAVEIYKAAQKHIRPQPKTS